MDNYTFESNVGKSKTVNLILDGEQSGTFLVYPIIPFVQRAMAVQSVIDSVADESDYMPYNYNFALTYNLLPFFTDLQFPDVEIPDIEDETEDERKARQRNANLTSAFEFIARSNVTEVLWANIPNFAELVEEINAGITFAKQKLLNNTTWNRLGDKILDLLDTASDVLSDPDTLEGLRVALDNLGAAETANEE